MKYIKAVILGFLVVFATSILLLGCGPDYRGGYGIPGAAGSNGTNGKDGANGSNGSNGINGNNALVAIVAQGSGGGASCLNGGVTILSGTDNNRNGNLEIGEVLSSADVCNGVDGQDGQDGTNGTNGSNGSNGSNGTNGTNGTNGVTPTFSVVALIDPCGDAPGIYDEIFLRLQNNTIIASFSDNANGQNTRFASIVPGNYVTTDGSNCHFSVDSALNVTW